MLSDELISRAWDSWSQVWDPKERSKGSYQAALHDLTERQFRDAARLALSECRFWPTPYDIKRLAPPPASAVNAHRSIPDGWRFFDVMSTDELRAHTHRCETAFDRFPKTRFGELARKQIAIQHVLCTRRIEHGEKEPDSAEHGQPDQSRLPLVEG